MHQQFSAKHFMAAFTGAAALLSGAPLASAQEAQTSSAVPEEVETVVVTGSRIHRDDYVSDSPLVTVSASAMSETGSTSVEHLLNQLPQFVPSITTTSNNPANGGQANIDLRGLGTQRNLVLLNGRRLPASNSNGTVDVNIVPAALIENIEVVTGGASAVYGSDAIAGVTNFTLKKDFEGVAIDSGYAKTAQSDGAEWTSSLTVGSNFSATPFSRARAISRASGSTCVARATLRWVRALSWRDVSTAIRTIPFRRRPSTRYSDVTAQRPAACRSRRT
jgi:outer membrane cobalamin receptor